jgi:hypothetical protein
MKPDDRVRVTVHYMAAGKPFEQDFASSATVGDVKAASLHAFDLTEGANQEGNTVTYTLYDKKDPLENMSITIGQLAGEQKVLQLKLSQQITQG